MRRLALVALIALAFPASAFAHATLESTSPHFRQELQQGPKTIRLHFDQSVRLLPNAVKVLDEKGRDHAGAARTRGTDVIAIVHPLPAGAYTVRWQAISADSHVVSGVWTFGVRVPAPAVEDAYGAGGPTRTEDIVRWIWFLGMALTIGALGLRLIVLRGLDVPLALERRIAVAAGLGCVVTLQAGVAAFSLRAEDALQLPFGRFLYGDLSPMAQTRFGEAFITMTLVFAAALALVYLSWLLDRVALLVPAFVLALVFVGGLSVSGHDGSGDPGSSWKTEIADWVHLSAASLWIGGLAVMAVLLWRVAPELRRTAFLRFSRLATILVALVLAAGVYLAIVRLPQLRDLWATGYGHVLLLKIALVCIALAWGAFHHFVVRPRLESADLPRLGRSLAGESMIGVAVLLLAAVLVDSKPPPRPVPPAPAAARLLAWVAAPAPTTVAVGDSTYGLARGGGSVWVGELTTGDVARIDPTTGEVLSRVNAGARIFNLASAPGAVWAVGNLSNTAARIDTRTGRVTATVKVGLAPYDVAWGFGSAWVSNSGSGTVTRITNGKVAKTIRVGVEPNGLTAYAGSLWVSDHTRGKVVRIDPSSNRVTGSVALAGADWITGLGSSLYVSQETNVVARVDLRTLKVVGRTKVAANPLGSAVVAGRELWVPCIDGGEIDVVDPATMRVLRRLKGGVGPIVVLDAFGHRWVSHIAGPAIWRF